MGLCKCPKKRVTNLFCFEHRVNVCENCLVANHPKCVVQSYLQWLQDSDYDPNCRLCGKNLADDVQECVRLTCYDVFHWSCIDNYARRLPANTAPAGYTCPMCKQGIFPPHNAASPVTQTLREMLSKVNWARAGLGLPLIEESSAAPEDPPPYAGDSASVNAHPADGATCTHIPAEQTHYPHHSQASQSATVLPHSVVNVGDSAPYARGVDKAMDFMGGQKPWETLLNTSHDHDEDKYKRRPAMQWFSRWFKSQTSGGRKDPNANAKRYAVLVILGILGFLTIILIFSRLGRASTDNDPFLDPMANPNIRVNPNVGGIDE